MKTITDLKNANHIIREFIDSDDDVLLIKGDVYPVIELLPDSSLSMAMTSPPYWEQRQYEAGLGLGNEEKYQDYIINLIVLFSKLKTKLRNDGSFWLNLGDKYYNKQLMGIPWRVAIAMQDDGWILRNDVIWDKVKGSPCNSRDKLRNIHEHVFHFVKNQNYYYDVDAIRQTPGKIQTVNGKLTSATGVSGVKYRQQIISSKELNSEEKKAAISVLEETLEKMRMGELNDFRMIIRGQQRSTHSGSENYSGRASELKKKGYCILPYHKNGAKPSDIWSILPEDSWRTDSHAAVYPTELCDIPIKTTSKLGQIVFDPFLGTGTTAIKSMELHRKFIGVEICEDYFNVAVARVKEYKTAHSDKSLLEIAEHEQNTPRVLRPEYLQQVN